MSLFNKKIKISSEPKCACQQDCQTEKCNHNSNDKIGGIKVLGSGCKTCHTLYENVKEATKNLDLSVEVEYVTDMKKVMKYGVMSMPALVVNEKVVAMGKLLKVKEIENILKK